MQQDPGTKSELSALDSFWQSKQTKQSAKKTVSSQAQGKKVRKDGPPNTKETSGWVENVDSLPPVLPTLISKANDKAVPLVAQPKVIETKQKPTFAWGTAPQPKKEPTSQPAPGGGLINNPTAFPSLSDAAAQPTTTTTQATKPTKAPAKSETVVANRSGGRPYGEVEDPLSQNDNYFAAVLGEREPKKKNVAQKQTAKPTQQKNKTSAKSAQKPPPQKQAKSAKQPPPSQTKKKENATKTKTSSQTQPKQKDLKLDNTAVETTDTTATTESEHHDTPSNEETDGQVTEKPQRQQQPKPKPKPKNVKAKPKPKPKPKAKKVKTSEEAEVDRLMRQNGL